VKFPFALADDPCYEYSPDSFDAIFATTKGNFTISVTRDWAPNSADRFWSAMHCGHYGTDAFFWVEPKIKVQWGLSGNPSEDASWSNLTSDVLVKKNTAGYVSFYAPSGFNSGNTEIFVNLGTNPDYDQATLAPFGLVNDTGLQVIQKFYSGYGTTPNDTDIRTQGTPYLQTNFPLLDTTSATDVHVYCARTAETCQYIDGDNYAVQCCTDGEQCITNVGCRCLPDAVNCKANYRNFPRSRKH